MRYNNPRFEFCAKFQLVIFNIYICNNKLMSNESEMDTILKRFMHLKDYQNSSVSLSFHLATFNKLTLLKRNITNMGYRTLCLLISNHKFYIMTEAPIDPTINQWSQWLPRKPMRKVKNANGGRNLRSQIQRDSPFPSSYYKTIAGWSFIIEKFTDTKGQL